MAVVRAVDEHQGIARDRFETGVPARVDETVRKMALGDAEPARGRRFEQRAAQRGVRPLVGSGQRERSTGSNAKSGRTLVAKVAIGPAFESIIPAGTPERNPQLAGAPLENGGSLPPLPGAHRGSALLQDAGLLRGDLGERGAQPLQ